MTEKQVEMLNAILNYHRQEIVKAFKSGQPSTQVFKVVVNSGNAMGKEHTTVRKY